MATALSQTPLFCSLHTRHASLPADHSAHSGSCHLDTLLTPPPLPGLVSSMAPCFIWRHHLTQQTPAVPLLSRGRLLSLPGPLHSGSVPPIASDGHIWDVWCMLVSSHLNNTKAEGCSCFTHHGVSCWAQNQQVLNKWVHPSCIQFLGDEHRRETRWGAGKTGDDCGYWPSPCTQMKTITSNYLDSLWKSRADLIICTKFLFLFFSRRQYKKCSLG